MKALTRASRLCGVLLFASIAAAHGRDIESLEFSRQPISDILIALGEFADTTVIPDATVTGTTSYYFSETTFEEALSAFAEAHDLYIDEASGVYRVSRIQIEVDVEAQLVSLQARDVAPEPIVNRLAQAIQ